VARTRAELRQMTVEQLEVPLIKGTAAGSGNSTSTMRDNDLERFSDNDLTGAWLHLSTTLTSPTFKDLRITDNVQSTGILTFRPTLAAIPNLESYEILPYESIAIHTAINESMDELYDSGTLVRNIWINHWMTGSPIYNATFDYWTDADGSIPPVDTVDGWTVATTAVSRLSYSSDHIIPGQNAVRLAAHASGGTLTLDKKYSQFLHDLRGQSVNLRAWVRTEAASNSRVQILADGRTDADVLGSSDYHSGDGGWEMVSTGAGTISNSTTEITIRLQNSGTVEGDFGAVWLEGGSGIREYPFPITLAPDGPDSVFHYPVDVNESDKASNISARSMSSARFNFHKYRYDSDEMGVVELHSRPTGARVLRMPTSAPLTLPTSDSHNVEVTRIDALLICKMAASKLLLKDMLHGPTTFRQRAAERANILMGEVRSMVEGRGASAADAVPLVPSW